MAGQTLKLIEQSDEFGFLQGVTNWCNHRPLLLLSLYLTIGPVYEFGSGEGSTPYLRSFCTKAGRRFYSFDNSEIWCEKTKSHYVESWDLDGLYVPCGVCFIDHAPGEHRHVAVERLADKADIIVIHDTEEGGQGNYMFDKIWYLFKYRLNYNRLVGGAGATAVSNKINLNEYRGMELGSIKFDID